MIKKNQNPNKRKESLFHYITPLIYFNYRKKTFLMFSLEEKGGKLKKTADIRNLLWIFLREAKAQIGSYK